MAMAAAKEKDVFTSVTDIITDTISKTTQVLSRSERSERVAEPVLTMARRLPLICWLLP
jgi:hypothetical protein